MPHATKSDWETISSRLSNLPGAVDGYIETLGTGIRDGQTPAKCQVRKVLEQTRWHAAADGFFFSFTGGASLGSGLPLPESLKADLAKGTQACATAYTALTDFFETELEPAAAERDAVGRELYALQSRRFLGATIDVDETYEWGVEEFERMVADRTAIANEIKPGASVEEAIAFLEADTSRKLHGTDALREWMQRLADTAIADLSQSHFDIPEPVRKIECMVAPTQEGGIYYTSPSDDFSRAGLDTLRTALLK